MSCQNRLASTCKPGWRCLSTQPTPVDQTRPLDQLLLVWTRQPVPPRASAAPAPVVRRQPARNPPAQTAAPTLGATEESCEDQGWWLAGGLSRVLGSALPLRQPVHCCRDQWSCCLLRRLFGWQMAWVLCCYAINAAGPAEAAAPVAADVTPHAAACISLASTAVPAGLPLPARNPPAPAAAPTLVSAEDPGAALARVVGVATAAARPQL